MAERYLSADSPAESPERPQQHLTLQPQFRIPGLGAVLMFVAGAYLVWWLLGGANDGPGTVLAEMAGLVWRYLKTLVWSVGLGGGAPTGSEVTIAREAVEKLAVTIGLGAGGLVLALGVSLITFYFALRRGWNLSAMGTGIFPGILRLPAFVVGLVITALLVALGLDDPRYDIETLIPRLILCIVALGIGGGMIPDLLRTLSRSWIRARRKEYAQMAIVRGESVMGHVRREILAPILDFAISRWLHVLGGVIAVEYLLRLPGIGYHTIDLLLNCQGRQGARCVESIFISVLAVMLVAWIADAGRRVVVRLIDPRYGEETDR